jgi:hypothetical protein
MSQQESQTTSQGLKRSWSGALKSDSSKEIHQLQPWTGLDFHGREDNHEYPQEGGGSQKRCGSIRRLPSKQEKTLGKHGLKCNRVY